LLSGSQSFGNPKDDSKPWSLKFNNEKFDEILFATGDMDFWMTMTRKEAIGEFYAGQKRTILKSSLSCSPTQAVMYRRSGNKEDPWISPKDHSTAIKEGMILYGENGFGGRHSLSLLHDGADVYIRSKVIPDNNDDEEEEEEEEEEVKPKKEVKKKAKKDCDTKPVPVNYLGDDTCTKNKPCDIGEGDCDKDSDCKAGLKCGQRSNFEPLPGLTGFEKYEG
jgi:hypothetical protein